MEQVKLTNEEIIRVEDLTDSLIESTNSKPEKRAELVRRLSTLIEGVKLGLILQTAPPNDAA